MKVSAVRIGILALALAGGSDAQTQFVSVEPECRIYFSFTGVGVSASYDNRTRGCNFWVVSYSSYVFAGPLSLALQSAPNADPGAPGAWVNFAGAIVAGVNPNTSIVGAETQAQGYYPWIRMNLTATGAGAGLVVGTAYGWRTGPAGAVTILGTPSFNLAQYGGAAVGAGNAIHTRGFLANGAFPVVASNSPVDGTANNVGAAYQSVTGSNQYPMVLPMVFNGTTWDRIRGSTAGLLEAGLGSGAVGGVITAQTVCTDSAPVVLAGAGTVEIVPASAGASIRVCHLSASWSAAQDVTLVYGTGVNCAVGTTALTGTYEDAVSLALDLPQGPLRVPASNALCVTTTAAAAGGGLVTYAVY